MDGSGIAATGAAGNEQADVGVPQRTLIQMLQEQQRQFIAQQEAQREAAAEQQRQLVAQQEVLRQATVSQQAEQQRLIERLMEQQKEEMQRYRVEMLELKEPVGKGASVVKLPKPTLKRLTAEDDIEHYLATFERVAKQQKWPKEVWASQLGGLMTGNAMAAYASLEVESTGSYDMVKQAVLRRYDVNEETHRLHFR